MRKIDRFKVSLYIVIMQSGQTFSQSPVRSQHVRTTFVFCKKAELGCHNTKVNML